MGSKGKWNAFSHLGEDRRRLIQTPVYQKNISLTYNSLQPFLGEKLRMLFHIYIEKR